MNNNNNNVPLPECLRVPTEAERYAALAEYHRQLTKAAGCPDDCTELAKLAVHSFNNDNPHLKYSIEAVEGVDWKRLPLRFGNRYYLKFTTKPDLVDKTPHFQWSDQIYPPPVSQTAFQAAVYCERFPDASKKVVESVAILDQ